MTENEALSPPGDPWVWFRAWLALAEQQEINDPNAMSLATLGADGMPSVRVVLLKSLTPEGLVFFTNRQSRKGEQLAQQPRAAICLHWKSLRRQIRAEGDVQEIDDDASDAYYATRPRASQIGAWASAQSRPLPDRATLEQHIHEIEERFKDQPIPRPPYWGGYRLVPQLIEFWQEQPYRLHDRYVYQRRTSAEAWSISRLYP